MSIPHLQVIDNSQLSSKDKAIISDSESRRFKFSESPSKRICDSPSSMSAGKKRVREVEFDFDSDEEDVPRVEGAKDDDESRSAQHGVSVCLSACLSICLLVCLPVSPFT